MFSLVWWVQHETIYVSSIQYCVLDPTTRYSLSYTHSCLVYTQ
ncbi:hypothetical protein LOK49_LG14G00977 [Camellia lanceoleosa]|uniref:Uncharacterized protein n=1 Tax=Camellia lanceoleosa TaxID=1840588 RepID=A0ACC0FD98_9ERIC|nr:hypothetical protein LOK49_LG14G00977 [Camellia lanceoleosa]